MIEAHPRPEDFEKYYNEYSEAIVKSMPDDSPYLRDCHIAKILARAYEMTEAEASERIGRIKGNGTLKIGSTDSHRGQKPKMTGKVRYMTNINVSGNADFEKVKMEHESRHQATIKEIKDIKEFPPHKNAKDQTTMVEKIPFVFDVDGKDVSALVANKVTKGSGSYQDSKMYVFLDKSGDLEAFLKEFGEGETESEAVMKFLKDRLLNRKCEVEISNAKRDTEDEYSMVGKIIKFADVPAATPASEPAKAEPEAPKA